MINRASAPLREVRVRASAAQQKVTGLQHAFSRLSAVDYYAIGQSVSILGHQIEQAAVPGIRFEDMLSDVQALTGVTGKALERLGDRARASAKTFGGSAADSLNTYKIILSRLGPGIAKNQEALAGMERDVRILSKTMGNDAGAAVDALSTAVLQFGVDLSHPAAAQKRMTQMMNVMAAGSKQGAAEVPAISAALKVAGVEASKSKLSFVAVNAALQALAKGGKQGAEAGTALRNVLAKMSGADVIPKQALEKLARYGVDMQVVSDTSLPFTERLRELSKAQGDATIFAQMFGVENAAAANILVRSVDAQQALQSKIKGTNTAFEQAKVKMDTFSERMNRWRATLSDLGISFFKVTKNALPFVQITTVGLQTFANWKALTQGFSTLFKTRWIANLIRGRIATRALVRASSAGALTAREMAVSTAAVGEASVASLGPLAAMRIGIRGIGEAIISIPIIGWILGIIAVAIPLFKYLWNHFAWFRGAIYGLWNVIKLVFGKIRAFIAPMVSGIANAVKASFGGLWRVCKRVLGGLWHIVSRVFGGIYNRVSHSVGSLWKYLKKALGLIAGLFQSVLGGVYDFFCGVFQGIYHTVMGVIQAIVGAVKKAWHWLSGFFSQAKSAYDKGMDTAEKELSGTKPQVEHPEKSPQAHSRTPEHLRLTQDAESPVGDSLGLKPGNLSVLGIDGSRGQAPHAGGTTRTINQNLHITNHFKVGSNLDIKDMAERVAALINDHLRDGLLALQ